MSAKQLENARQKLAVIQAEQRRQIMFAGERLGVFARLKELGRDERRILKRIDALETSSAQASGREQEPSK